MFDVEITPPKPVKLPTFLQYLKTAKISKGVENSTLFTIDLIWLPGQFDNVTLQTYAFRYILTPETALYQPVIDYCNDLPEGKIPQFGIYITSLETKAIRLGTHPKKQVGWERVGENGIKFV